MWFADPAFSFNCGSTWFRADTLLERWGGLSRVKLSLFLTILEFHLNKIIFSISFLFELFRVTYTSYFCNCYNESTMISMKLFIHWLVSQIINNSPFMLFFSIPVALVLIPIDLKFELISKFKYFNLNRRIAVIKLNRLKYSNEPRTLFFGQSNWKWLFSWAQIAGPESSMI